MGIPEEDLGPAWLRDYDYSDFGGIEADIQAMKEFAAKLTLNIEGSYAPHAQTVSDTMMTPLPEAPNFYELHLFLYAHDQVQLATQKNVFGYIDNTYRFASAADQIGDKYSDSDAFSRAKVTDVQQYLGAGATTTSTGTGTSTGGSGNTNTTLPNIELPLDGTPTATDFNNSGEG
ncbi:hypothetical protein [Actinoplanes derwentensis]|uniref:Uncharacterized protein n=1 Tax=Actinoplanes derwentensis TaxID=113562 RepID=A0A1H2D143_9ACTN|nr:hypothetical protein [Actinoplanes derwentensis]GID90005.1 hypothetical protein Ade03nite_89290 [Actinoplanes derwentensis]SDT76468.1 hypothetical protein SAMN04489716_7630 [Actinoplanes derwentensis]